MARPKSRTVQYFPHMANASSGKTLFTLEAKFGVAGYAAWFKMLERVASTDGHFLNLNDEATWIHTCAFMKMDEATATDFFDTCSRLGAICSDHWDTKIVWSESFVAGVEDAYKRRKSQLPLAPLSKEFMSTETELMSTETPTQKGLCREYADISTESKLKESKVNEIKEKHSPSKSPSDSFESFWTAYPKKVGKQDARKKYRTQKAEAQIDVILKDLAYRKTTRQWTENGGQFIPNPSTYLNQRRWEDERVEEAAGGIKRTSFSGVDYGESTVGEI